MWTITRRWGVDGTHLTLILGAVGLGRLGWCGMFKMEHGPTRRWWWVTKTATPLLNDVSRTPGRLGWDVVATWTREDLKAGLKSLDSWLDTHPVDRAVLTTRVGDDPATLGWIALLEGRGVDILVVPGALDYMAGTVRSSNLFGVPLVNLSKPGLTAGMRVVKRALTWS